MIMTQFLILFDFKPRDHSHPYPKLDGLLWAQNFMSEYDTFSFWDVDFDPNREKRW